MVVPFLEHPVKLLRDDLGVLVGVSLIGVHGDVGNAGHPVLKFDIGSKSRLHDGIGFSKVGIDYMRKSFGFKLFCIIWRFAVDQSLSPRPKIRRILILFDILICNGDKIVRGFNPLFRRRSRLV